jgi:hypothetical protein
LKTKTKQTWTIFKSNHHAIKKKKQYRTCKYKEIDLHLEIKNEMAREIDLDLERKKKWVPIKFRYGRFYPSP